MNNEHNKLDYKIKKLVELYLNNVKFDDLSKIEEILAAGNSPTCHFQNINEFFSHYQEFSNNKNLDKNKAEMILNYFSSNGYILNIGFILLGNISVISKLYS